MPKTITMQMDLHLTREFLIRRWVAVKLIMMAAWVLGCNIEIKTYDVEQSNV